MQQAPVVTWHTMPPPQEHTQAVPAALQRGVPPPHEAAQHTLPVPAMLVTQNPLAHCPAVEQALPLATLAAQVPALHHWFEAHWASLAQAPHDVVVEQKLVGQAEAAGWVQLPAPLHTPAGVITPAVQLAAVPQAAADDGN